MKQLCKILGACCRHPLNISSFKNLISIENYVFDKPAFQIKKILVKKYACHTFNIN